MVPATFLVPQVESDLIDPTQFYISVPVPDSILVPILIVLVGGSRTVPSSSVPLPIVAAVFLLDAWIQFLVDACFPLAIASIAWLTLLFAVSFQIVGTDINYFSWWSDSGNRSPSYCSYSVASGLVSLRSSGRLFLDLPRRPTLRTVRIQVLT